MKNSLSIFAIMILGAVMMAFTESKTITGKVTDTQGQAIPGVSVRVKGASSGTVTDYTGHYKIIVDQQAKILTFSCAGYTVVEEKIGSRSIIDVRMMAELTSMDELVVTGYGARKDVASKSMAMPASAGMSYESKRSYQHYNNNFNTEGYAAVNESGFKNVKNNPLSTFSIDVDKASYSNIRRFINTGVLPPADAVRIEEMVNYFKYDYPEPEGEHPFSVYTELSVCPWNQRHQLLHVGLRGKSIDKSSLPSSNLVFLLDVSGSMNAQNKLAFAQIGIGFAC